MAKAVFRPGEVTLIEQKVMLDPPHAYPESAHLAPPPEEKPEETAVVEEYQGPTVEDLRQEAELFKTQWEAEKEAMILAAKAEADGIIKEAEEAAAQEVQQKTDQAQAIKQSAEDEAEKILADARQQAQDMESSARTAFDHDRQEAEEQGRTAGREAGFAEGKAEVDRLIERTQVILERAQGKRAEILEETEQQIIDLVLLITRKVIKVISDSQRTVVIQNVAQALRKVKPHGNILIRVNMADVKLTTDHIKDFIQMMEGAKGVQVAEDSSVDAGGCIIETDFGEIDARISSQLAELETKILELSPIKGRAKTNPGSGSAVPRAAPSVPSAAPADSTSAAANQQSGGSGR